MSTTRHTEKFRLVFLLFFLALSCIYFVPLVSLYAHHDDYHYAPPKLAQEGTVDFCFLIGRPAAGLLFAIAQLFVSKIIHLNFLRLLTIINLSVLATILFGFVNLLVRNRVHSLLGILCFLTLPPFVILVSWASAFHIGFALMLSGFAAQLAFLAPEHIPLRKKILHQQYLGSFLLLFLALLTYPTAAMFYWVFVFLGIAAHEEKSWPKQKDRIFSSALIGFGAIGLYMLFLKLSAPMTNGYTLNMLYDPYQINIRFLDKFIWFLREPLMNVLNLWNVYPSPKGSSVTLGFLILSLGLYLFKNFHRSSPKKFIRAIKPALGRGALFLICSLLSFLPNLVSSMSAPFYRGLLGLTAMFILALLWAIREWVELLNPSLRSKAITLILAIALFSGALQANHTIYFYRILPSLLEFNYAQKILANINTLQGKNIDVIEPLASPLERYDEFAAFSSRFPQDMKHLIVWAYLESHKNGRIEVADQFHLRRWDKNQIWQENNSGVLLDMRFPQKIYKKIVP